VRQAHRGKGFDPQIVEARRVLIYVAVLFATLAAFAAGAAGASFAALGVGIAVIVGFIWFCVSSGLSLFGP
jgi:hypothetical protein